MEIDALNLDRTAPSLLGSWYLPSRPSLPGSSVDVTDAPGIGNVSKAVGRRVAEILPGSLIAVDPDPMKSARQHTVQVPISPWEDNKHLVCEDRPRLEQNGTASSATDTSPSRWLDQAASSRSIRSSGPIRDNATSTLSDALSVLSPAAASRTPQQSQTAAGILVPPLQSQSRKLMTHLSRLWSGVPFRSSPPRCSD